MTHIDVHRHISGSTDEDVNVPLQHLGILFLSTVLGTCPLHRAFFPVRRITEHDGTVSLLDSCLHGNAEPGDNLEASRRPLDFVKALNSVEETEKRGTSQG